MQVSTIGLDLAKHVFQVHGIDANEKVVVRKQLRRSQVMAFFEALPPCQHRLCFRQNPTVRTSTISAWRITGVEALRSRTTGRSMGPIEYERAHHLGR